jgi:hypothetical protein
MLQAPFIAMDAVAPVGRLVTVTRTLLRGPPGGEKEFTVTEKVALPAVPALRVPL